MKTFAIIVKNMGITLICVLIGLTTIMYFETEGIETTAQGKWLIGIAIGLYLFGKTVLELVKKD